MKKIKRLFSILMMSLVALFVFAGTNKAQAATTNEGLNIEYKVFKASDYDAFVNKFGTTYDFTMQDLFSDLQIANARYINRVEAGKDEATCLTQREKYWDEKTMLGPTNGPDTTITLAEADAIYNEFYNMEQPSSFVPGQEIVIVPFVKVYNNSNTEVGFNTVDIFFNFKPQDGASWDWDSNVKTIESATLYPASTFYSNSERENDDDTIEASIDVSAQKILGDNQAIGFQFGHSNTTLRGEWIAGAARVKLSSSLNGNYKISVNGAKYEADGSVISTYYNQNQFSSNSIPYYIASSSGLWTEAEKIISIAGANSDNSIKNVSVGGTVLDSNNSTITSTGSNEGEIKQQFVYNKGESGTVSVTVTPTSGSVKAVKWSSTDFTNALSGTPITNITAGTFDVDMTNVDPGKSIYLAVQVEATDGTTIWHNISIPRAKSNDALLKGLVVKDASGNTISFDNSETFSGSDFTYSITIPENTQSLKINANFDDGIQTAKITTSTITNATLTDTTDYPLTNLTDFADGKTIDVTCVAQDGSTNKTYTITVNHVSSNAILENTPTSTADGTGNSIVVNKTDPVGTANGTITVSGIDYSASKFTFTPSLTDGQTAVIKFGGNTYTPGSDFTFPTGSSGYGENKVTGTIVVTAADGTTKATYDIIVTRSAADTDNSISGITVTYTGGTKNVSNPVVSTSGDNTVTGIPYGITTFDVAITLPDGKIKHVEIGNGNGFVTNQTTYSETGFTLSTNYTGVSTTVVIRVKAEDQDKVATYNLIVERDDASSDNTITSVTVSYTGQSGVTIYPDASGNLVLNDVPYSVNTFNVKVTLADGKTKTVSFDNVPQASAAEYTLSNVAFPTGYANISKSVAIKVVAQNQSIAAKTYNLTVNRKDASNANKLSSLTIEDNEGTSLGTFNPSTQTFSTVADLEAWITSYTFTATLDNDAVTNGAVMKYYIRKGTSTTRTQISNTTVEFGTYGNVTELIIEIKAENPNAVNTITIPITRKTPDTNAKITYTATGDLVYPNGATDPDYNIEIDGPNNGTFVNKNPIVFDTKNVTLTITPDSAYTVIEINSVKAEKGQAATATLGFTSLSAQPISFTVKVYTQNNYNVAADTYIYTFTRVSAQNDLELDVDMLHPTTNTPATQKNAPVNHVYSYIVKQSEFGNQFKIKAELDTDSRSDVYVSTNINDFSDPTSVNPALAYDATALYNIETTVYVCVVSELKQKRIYTLQSEFTDERDQNNTISKIEVYDITDGKNIALTDKYSFGDGSNHAPSFSVAYAVKKLKYVVTLQSLASSLAPGSKNTLATGNVWVYEQELSVGSSNVVSFVCTAENDVPNANPYNFTVTRNAGSSLKFVETLNINGIDCLDSANITDGYILKVFNKYQNTFDIVFPRGTNMFNIDFTYSAGADMFAYVEGDSTQQFTTTPCCVSGNYDGSKMQFKIQITAEVGGVPSVYTINVYVADQEYTISDIEILKQDQSAPMLNTSDPQEAFDFIPSSTAAQNHNVAFKGNENAYIDVQKALNSSNAVVTGIASNGLVALTAGSTTPITITIKSEYANLNPNVTNQFKTYKININRAKASNNAYLSKLDVYLDGAKASFDDGITFTKENGNYAISNIPLPSTCNVDAVLDDIKASMTGDYGNVTIELIEGTKIVQNLKIEVTAEDGQTKKTYTVKLSLEQYVPSPINTLTNLEAIADGTNMITNFSNNQQTYNITVDATTENIYIKATKGNDLQTITIKCNAIGFSSETDNHTFALTNGTVTEIIVIVSPEDENAEDREFTINVTRPELDDDNTLKDLKFNGTTIPGFTAEDDEYDIYVTGDVTQGYLEATMNSSVATILPYNDINNKYDLAVGKNTLKVTVKSQGGDPKVYTVNVHRDPSLYLSNLEVIVNSNNLIEGFTKENTLYPATGAYNVDYKYSTAQFIATPEYTEDPSLLTITYAGNTNNTVSLSTGSKTYVVRVTAPSKAYKDYTVSINRAEGKQDAYITQYVTEAGETLSLVVGQFDYKYRVDKTVSIYNPQVSFSEGSSNDFSLVNNTSLTQGTVNSKTIKVTSEDGQTVNTYTFYIYPASNDVTIDDINVLDPVGRTDIVDCVDNVTIVDHANKVYSINVPYNLASAYLEVISDAKVMVNNTAYTNSNQLLSVGPNVFKIYVISEYGQLNPEATDAKSEVITVTINKETPNSDASLGSLVIKTENGTDLLVDLTTGTSKFVGGMAGLDLVGTKQYEKNYTIANIGNISSVSISYIPTVNSTTVVPVLTNGVVKWTLGDSVANAGDNSVFTFEKSIVCTATDGTIATYNITLMRGPLDPDEDNAVIDIKVQDSNGNSYLNNFTQGQPTYGPFEIPYGIQSYTISASKNEFTYAVLSCINTTDLTDSGFAIRTIGSDFYDAEKLAPGKNYREIVYKVYATADKGNGAKGTEYYVTLRFLAPSNDNTLSSIKVDSVDVPNYNPQTTDYSLPDIRTYTTSTAEFKVTLSDTNAEVISINGNKPTEGVNGTYTSVVDLKIGLHVYKIVVKAQNGDIREYNIEIQRDSETPYLIDLSVSGQVLLDKSGANEVDFDKAEREYRVMVTYLTDKATIVASVDNTNYTMSCTNATLNANSTFTTNYFDVSNLEVGENVFVITVRSTANKTFSYTLTIIRRTKAEMNTDVGGIDIIEVPEFKEDYDNINTVYDKETYNYIVPNKVVDLEVIVDLKDLDNMIPSGATYEIYNATNLKVGDNKVIILVTAQDGKTTKAIIVDVYRKEMEYQFDKNAYSQFEVNELEKDEKGRARYEVNLNNKNASAIEDFTKYITFNAAENNITVKEITDKYNANRNEVVLEITDGDKTDQVVIQLNTTANNGNAVFDWGVWILLGVAIVILIIILIAVNRDKYGSVTHKRKRLD